jgi:putative transposase
MIAGPVSYKRHRFPSEIITHAVWLYFRFPLSLRLVEEMLLERGIVVSYETIRRWAIKKTGAAHARRPKRKVSARYDIWRLDEVVISIGGEKRYLWRAVAQEGYVFDEIVQIHRGKGCATITDAALAQARTSAEADHHRQTRLLRRRQA